MLSPSRFSIPIKGWNTITPIREMGHEYATALENIWFDQAAGMNRRPGQQAIVTNSIASGIESLFEYRDIAGTSTIFSWSNGIVYKQSGSTFNSDLVFIFNQRVRSQQMGGAMIVGDGITTRTYTTAGGWSASAPTGAQPMNMFTVYKGRMYGAGNPGAKMTLYYSDVVGVGSAGITDWTATGPGGFIDLTGAIGTGDEITGISNFQGMLVVFLQNAIVFYSGVNPIFTSIQKVIRGIGCVSHDSIQGIGNDLIFLSRFGFKKLSEVLVQGDAAAGDASTPINNYVVNQLEKLNVSFSSIRSTFAEKFGVYLCTFGNLTLAYHVFFDAWSPWYGLGPTLYTKEDGTVLVAGTTLQQLSTSAYGDTIGDATESPIPMRWDSAPFRSKGAEIKARWRFIELIYESNVNEPINVSTWIDLDLSTMITNTVTLSPTIVVPTPDSMVWGSSSGSSDLRRKWGNVTNKIKWAGSTTGTLSGDVRIPIVGRSELLTMRVANENISAFKITANEIYTIDGGLRP